MKLMKYRQALLMNLLAIFGFSIICGCSGLGAKKIERPQVPSDFPFPVVWLQPKKKAVRINELTQRELWGLVMVKKWNEGDRFIGTGMDMDTGKVYLNYPNVVYVKWEDTQLPDGTITKYVSEISGADSTIRDQVSEGILPPGVLVLDMKDMDASGIDPYEYLSD
ncbi:hypothetical protein C6499_05225 [Candidatus Poribacteria bacterium]|nr:MAG: hypothetical protein C6499_05225 [Candidatus Poribacteria bacterium]